MEEVSWVCPQDKRNKIDERVQKSRAEAQYLTIDGLITAEMGGGGGTPSVGAIDGAIRRALKCIARRGKWVHYDSDSERLTFRRVFKKEIRDFTTTHRRTQEERNDAKPIKDSVGVAEETPPPTSKVATTTANDITSASAETADKPGKPDIGDVTPDQQRVERQKDKSRPSKTKVAKGKAKSVAKGKTTKGKLSVDNKAVKRKLEHLTQTYHSTLRRAANRQHQISTLADWKWADNDKFGGKLTKLVGKTKDSVMAADNIFNYIEHDEPLAEDFLLGGSTSVRVLDDIQANIDAVDVHTKRLKELYDQDQTSSSQ
jgi:hypothetical protein